MYSPGIWLILTLPQLYLVYLLYNLKYKNVTKLKCGGRKKVIKFSCKINLVLLHCLLMGKISKFKLSKFQNFKIA